MSKETKELTTKQKIKRYRNLKLAAWMGEFVVLPIPLVVLSIVNRDTWFPNPSVGCQIGIGGGIAIALGLFVTLLVTKEQAKEPETRMAGGYVTVLLTCALMASIATLVRDIADQIAYIMWIEMSGIAAGFGLDITRKQMLKKEKENREILKTAENKRAVARADEELANEEAQKKVKIKIKK